MAADSTPRFWLVRDSNGFIQGPLEHDVVIRLIKLGRLKENDQASAYPDGEWTVLSRVPEFYDVIIDVLSGKVGLDEVVVNENDSAGNWTTRVHVVPPPKKEEKKSFVVVEGKSEAPKKSPPTPPKEKSSRPRATAHPSQPSYETIDLSDESQEIKKRKRIGAIGPILFSVVALVLVGLYFQQRQSTPKGQIHLELPRSGRPAISNEDVADLLRRAVTSFQQDTFSGYFHAQNLLIETLEGAPKNIEAMALLCLTFRELWPYSMQDSHDLSVVSQLSQAASQQDSLGEKGALCKLSQQIIGGQYESAQSKVKTFLSQYPDSPFFYEIQSIFLGDARDYMTGIAFAQRAQQLYPAWAKPYITEARYREKLGQFVEAKNLYERVLKGVSAHGVARVNLGRVEYLEFKDASGIQRIALALKDYRVPNSVRASGLEAMATYYEKNQDRKQAVGYAVEAYKLDPTNLNVKEIITRLGGSTTLPDIKTDCQEIIRLGETYLKSNNQLAAQAEFRTAFDTCEPKSAFAAMKAAQSLWKLNQSGDAIIWMEKAIKVDPKLIEAYVGLAEYYADRFEFDKAYTTLKQASQAAPQSYEVFRGYALVELKRNNFKDAIRYGEQALRLYDNDMETHLILIRAYQGAKDYRRGFQIASRAIELDKNNTRAQALYAEIYAGFQGVSAANDYVRNLINTYPTIAEYRITYAKILKLDDHWTDMVDVLNQVTQMDQGANNKEVRLLLGYAYANLNKTTEALESYLTAVTIDPSDAVPVMLIGDLYMQRGEFENARINYERARELNPKYPKVNFMVGRAYFKKGNYQMALDAAMKEQKINPSLSDSYVLAGESYLAQGAAEGGGKGLYAKAIEQFQRALKLRQQTAPVYILLARAHRLSGNYDIAVTMLNQASARESGNPDLFKERGAVYEKKGQIEQAVTAYSRYLELAPNAADYNDIQTRVRSLGGH